MFLGDEKPLDTEQWRIDTADLLKAGKISKEDQVEVAKIQLKDVVRA